MQSYKDRREAFMSARAATLNPHIRRAINNYRKVLNKKTEESNPFAAANSPRESEPDTTERSLHDPMRANWKIGDIQVTHAELARLIEQTYQYIYSVEDMRI